MKFVISCIVATLLVLPGCSSNKSNLSHHICLDVATKLYELESSNVAAISLNMPNNEGSVYFTMNEGQLKVICSSANFNISNNGLVISTPEQEVFYFQNSEKELVDPHKSANGFWYSKLAPKNKNQWLTAFFDNRNITNQ